MPLIVAIVCIDSVPARVFVCAAVEEVASLEASLKQSHFCRRLPRSFASIQLPRTRLCVCYHGEGDSS